MSPWKVYVSSLKILPTSKFSMNQRVHIHDVVGVIPKSSGIGWELDEDFDVACHAEHVDNFFLEPWQRRLKFQITVLKNSNAAKSSH